MGTRPLPRRLQGGDILQEMLPGACRGVLVSRRYLISPSTWTPERREAQRQRMADINRTPEQIARVKKAHTITNPICEPGTTKQAAHIRLGKIRGKASGQTCVDCNLPALDWSQKHATSGLDLLNDYEPRCRICYRLYDYTDEWRAKISDSGRRRYAK